MRKIRDTYVPLANGNSTFGVKPVRSYVIDPYKLVKDHDTEVETSDVQSVLNGDLDQFMLERLSRRT